MVAQIQNPGWQAGASRDLLCGHWSLRFPTVAERQEQLLTSRFCLSPSIARDMARLCFGERRHD